MSWREEAVPASESDIPPTSTAEPAWKADAELAGNTVGARLGAAGRGAAGSFIENAPIVGGMVAGAKLGVLGGPYAPVTVPAGMVLGGVSGYLAGREARKQTAKTGLVSESAENEPEELRPFAFGGEAFGGSIPFGGAPFAFTKQAANAPRFIKPILETAKNHPKSFIAAELGGASGSALGSALSEETMPGQTLPRVGAEILGGFLHPARLISQGSSLGMQGFKRAMQSWSEEGKLNNAAETLNRVITEAGEDPKAIIAALRENRLPGVNTTSGMKTASPVLVAFEQRLKQENAKFGQEYQRMADEGLGALEELARSLSQTGDPQALRLAAQVKQERFASLLEGRLAQAEQAATSSASRISSDRPGAASSISSQANDALKGALREARTVESSLWGQVPKDIFAPLENTYATYARIRADMLPEEKMPSIVEGFIERMRGEGRDYDSVGDLHKLRSKVLGFAREAAGKKEFNEARIYGEMADGILADMASVPSTSPILDEARSFSRAMHDAFDRSFARKGMDRASTGEQRLAPELMLERGFGSGGTGANLRLGQLEDAAWFGPRMGRPDTSLGREMTESQARFIRLMAAESVNPTTGRVNPDKLRTFIRDNDALLGRFPSVRADLQSAEGTERLLKAVETANKGARQAVEQGSAFSRILGVENPSRAIGQALSSDAPVANFQAIARMAQAGGDDALSGFRAATLNHAIHRATSQNGDFSFHRYQDALMRPLGQNQPSPMDIMQSAKAMTPEQTARYKAIVDEAAKIEGALRSGVALDSVLSVPDALYDLVLRIAGSNLAGMGVASQSSPLIAGAAGSKTMRQIFDKVPQGKIMNILVQSAKEPEFMAKLLERPATEKQRVQLARQVNGFLWNAGLVGGSSTEERKAREPSTAAPAALVPQAHSAFPAPQPQMAMVVPNTRGPGRPRKINQGTLGLDEALDQVMGTNDTFAELAAQ